MSSGQYPLLDSRNLIGIWNQMYEPALNGIWATQIGMIVPSTMETETYGWLGAAPGLEPMVQDNPTEEQLKNYVYALRNIEYAKSIRIKANDLRRDKIGQIRLRIGEMTEKAAEHWNVLGSQVILLNPTGYDKVAFFSGSHPEAVDSGGPIQSNDLTSTQIASLDIVNPAAPTALEAATALNAILGQFYLMVDDKNYPINGQAKEFLVVVGTAAMWTAFSSAANLFVFAQGAQNPIAGLKLANGLKVSVILIPQLNVPAHLGDNGDQDWSTKFAVFRTDSRVKPLILQDEMPVEPAVSNEQNDEYIKFRRFLFALHASRAAGVARWQSAIRAKFN